MAVLPWGYGEVFAVTSQRSSRDPVLERGDILDDGLVVDEFIGGSRKVDLYLCYSDSTKGLVACKVLRPRYRTDFSSLEAVLAEGEILIKLEHPNVVEAYSVALQPHPYIAMEYLQGQTLKATFLSGNYEAFAVPDIVSVGLQLADALTYVHEQGLLHLDVKPSNVMYEDGHVTLFDFSVAEEYSPDKPLYDNAGTRDYMAPEQTRRGRVSYATDVFGMGVVFYELLTGGKLPYDVIEEPDPDEDGETKKVLGYSRPPTAPWETNSSVPRAIGDLALAAVQPDPLDRPATPQVFKDRLLAAAKVDPA